MDVGNQIRERRQALGLSQEELAQRLYVSRVTVSHWETSKTLPDVQSMLLLANLFGTTIDELVRGDVDEMREMVEKNERRTRTLAVALAAVEVVVVTALAVTAVAGREYLEPALRLLLAVLALAFSVAVLAARRGRGARTRGAPPSFSARPRASPWRPPARAAPPWGCGSSCRSLSASQSASACSWRQTSSSTP
ncbi:helix-turn-helix transcriptional regulator [Enorma burkinafasonensis]|uniref:helix-turn-helix transcriptional regulator n=1 Tax=Enorma burkinafasonensis TaxID=2590867 RepID=UPI001FE54C4D|nr:helix-turn-helix transcriptional regulator [Enorma burkinafasonensis]